MFPAPNSWRIWALYILAVLAPAAGISAHFFSEFKAVKTFLWALPISPAPEMVRTETNSQRIFVRVAGVEYGERFFLDRLGLRYFEKSAVHKLLRTPSLLERFGKPVFCSSALLFPSAKGEIEVRYAGESSNRRLEFSCD